MLQPWGWAWNPDVPVSLGHVCVPDVPIGANGVETTRKPWGALEGQPGVNPNLQGGLGPDFSPRWVSGFS